MGNLKRSPRRGGVRKISARKRDQWIRRIKGLEAILVPRTVGVKHGRNEINPNTGRKYKYD